MALNDDSPKRLRQAVFRVPHPGAQIRAGDPAAFTPARF